METSHAHLGNVGADLVPGGPPVSWSPLQLLLLSVATLATLLLSIRLKLAMKKRHPPFKNIPVVPGGHWLTGHLRFVTGTFDMMAHVFRDHANDEGFASFWLLGGAAGVSILDAKHARTVLRQGEMRCPLPIAKRHVGNVLGGESLIFSSGGAPWMRQRRVVQHAFSALALVDYRPAVFAVARDVVSSLKKMCAREGTSGKGVEVDIVFLSQLFTMDVFGQIAMGYNFNCVSDCDDYASPHTDGNNQEANEMVETGDGHQKVLKSVKKAPENKAFDFLLDDLMLRCKPSSVFNPGLQFYWMPTERNRKRKEEQGVVDRLLTDIIQQRMDRLARERASAEENGHATNSNSKVQGRKRYDMLALMIQKNEDVTASTLAESMKTLLVAGYETTSVTISFVLKNLTKHVRCQERCAEEAKRIFGKHGDDYAGVIDEHEFKYLRATLMESMRLNSTVLVTQRETKKDLQLGRTFLPGGTRVVMPLTHILTDERNFDRPGDFCPERWVRWCNQKETWVERDSTKERNDSNHPPGPQSSDPKYHEQNAHAETISAGDVHNFLAFSHGVRDCVGKRLAWLEATIFVAFIVKDFAVDFDNSNPPLLWKRRLVTNYPHELPIILRKRA